MPNTGVRPARVIWITTDHQRYDGVGANGNPAIFTPHLDRLARGGVSFDNVFIQAPVSMPSRASFMTGLYPNQTGVTSNGFELPATGLKSCADLFAQGGFETAQIGKLHFQCHFNHDLRSSPRQPYGFQYVMLSEEPGCYEDAYTVWLRTEFPEHARELRVGRPFTEERAQQNIYTVNAPAAASHAGFCAEQTMKYLLQRQRQAGPCFIHMGLYAPHPPLNPPRELLARYVGVPVPPPEWRDGEAADKPEPLCNALNARKAVTREEFMEYRVHFYAMCTLLDSQIGRLLEFLEKRGELDDTLILFMSDHGDMTGDHRMLGKDQFFHQVMRVPVILHWPRGLPGGRRVAGLVEAVDLLPTLCDLSGVGLPASLSGISIAETLRGGSGATLREDVLAMHGAPNQALTGALRTRELNYIRYGKGREVLFDLRADPGEFVNCAPKPEYQGRLHEMRDRMVSRLLAAGRSILPAHYRF